MLAGLGCRFDADELSDFELECFMLIDSEIHRLESEDMKRKKR